MILLGGYAAQQQKVEQERKMVIESQGMVVTGDLDQPYMVLGQINYSEPVSGEQYDQRIAPVAGRTNGVGGWLKSKASVYWWQRL